jgi:hypothetical protein
MMTVMMAGRWPLQLKDTRTVMEDAWCSYRPERKEGIRINPQQIRFME